MLAFLAGLAVVLFLLAFLVLALPLLAMVLMKLHFSHKTGRPESRADDAENGTPPVIDVAWREVRNGPGKNTAPPGGKPGDC